MDNGKRTVFTHFGMMPTMITTSLADDAHYRVWSRGEVRTLWRELLYKTPFPATAHATPDAVFAGRRSTVTITLVPQKAIAVGGHVTLLLPEFWGGIAQERDCTTFFLRHSPQTYPGYVSSHITARATGACRIEGTITTAGSVHTVIDVVVLDAPLAPGDQLAIVIGDPCGQPVLPIDYSGTYFFNLAVDAEGNKDYAAVLPLPAVRVMGDTAQRYRVTVPACSAGDELAARVVPIDAALNRSELPVAAHEATEDTGDGFRRVVATNRNDGLAGRSNPSVRGEWVQGYNVYFGEIHTHTELSDAIRSLDDAYLFARDVLGLDFAAISDHFEKGQPSMVHRASDKWAMTKDAAARFHNPGAFVTLLGYEWGGKPHINIYYRGGDGLCVPADDPRGRNPADLYKTLAQDGKPFVAIPHHPKYLSPADWSVTDGPAQRLIEIYSGWGSSEDGNESAYRASLARGLRMGIIGGTDNHIGRPGQGNRTFEGGGLACVLAPALTREALFDALMARRCYGTTGARMLIDLRVNDTLMGGETAARPQQAVSVRAIGEATLSTVEILRNGEVVHTQKVAADAVKLEWEDASSTGGAYYARVTQRDGHVGWASPVWVGG
ncbi:MAG: hypothetical protein A3K19_32065 [Lentisphaerae bacterium RIFOXYB12_FULL_65_16]|nr:MAG: hypothetical protein A3K18_10845 [Lentisphaerae bacterium RIFOXYA12_64_32]OGV88738.1 MAG: hypothetical protein A3K19_32065 [Lentisphaerae bacterium RIFOXYB12_FULL_65_16]